MNCTKCAAIEMTELLSSQELKVLQLSWDGLSMKETAAKMGLSWKTVKNYRHSIFTKFGVGSVEGMLRRGAEIGYLSLATQSRMEDWP